ncbi:MAG: hypothetical protein HKN50_00985 [Gammaproteobacteria bacterium]|nr:hypothetical protein [Gammaproteobacteria bacterium]
MAEQAAGDQVPAYSQRRQIRFYKANRQGQTTRISFTARRARREGCQNFLKRTRVFQANQYGFAQCRLYSKRNCQAASILSVTRDKLPEPVTELSQGYSWHPVAEHKRGAKVRSWDCWVSDPAVTEPKAE